MIADRDNPYLLVDLEQGSDEWLHWRRGGLGASDAPTIMGENPWKTAQELRVERQHPNRRKQSKFTAAMARGIRLEPEARDRYINLKKINVKPLCLQSTQWDWMRCSLDGICPETRTVVEIKCGASAYKSAASRHRIPRYYYGQIQHILAVTGYAEMDFYCYQPNHRPILVKCDRNDTYIERLITLEQAFWDSIQS